MFGLGVSELLIILVLVMFFYGGKKLPQIGEGLGKMIHEFRKATRTPAESTAMRPHQQSQSSRESRPEQGKSGD